jgi:hypothetical protein
MANEQPSLPTRSTLPVATRAPVDGSSRSSLMLELPQLTTRTFMTGENPTEAQGIATLRDRLGRHGVGPQRSSPLSKRAISSLAPPTSTPLWKHMGNVGQPVHILSAVRRRHSLV